MSVKTVASAVAVPSALNDATRRRSAPTSTQRPRMPLTVIITAAKTVSRARADVSGPPDTIKVTISATSMTVTATARMSAPNGSPTRCATTSAWCTAARTAPAKSAANSARTRCAGLLPHVTARATRASAGMKTCQCSSIRNLFPSPRACTLPSEEDAITEVAARPRGLEHDRRGPEKSGTEEVQKPASTSPTRAARAS